MFFGGALRKVISFFQDSDIKRASRILASGKCDCGGAIVRDIVTDKSVLFACSHCGNTFEVVD